MSAPLALLAATLIASGVTAQRTPEAVLADSALSGLTVGAVVLDVGSGRVLLERNATRPLVPASNQKLITTAAAVVELGAEWHFSTRIAATHELLEDGTLRGDLVLWGSGDPSLRADVFAQDGLGDPATHLAELLWRAGLRRVEGDLLLDESYFDQQVVHSDWDPGDLDSVFAAPISALSIHGNRVGIEIDGSRGGTSPRVKLTTLVDGYSLRSAVQYDPRKGILEVGALRPDAGARISVRGRLGRGKTYEFEVPVADPPLFFGRCLLAALYARGIDVDGGISRELSAASLHPGAVTLVDHRSPIDWPVLLANKESDNSMADHLFKALGAEAGDGGSFAGGGRAVTEFLARTVRTHTEGAVLRDGSGLSPKNRISARAVVDTLFLMHEQPEAQRGLFLRSLPVSGVDGSLSNRMTEAPYRGAVRAKTGWISGASSLSGYVHTAEGRVLAFSLLFNGLKPGTNARMKAVQDDFCRALHDSW